MGCPKEKMPRQMSSVVPCQRYKSSLRTGLRLVASVAVKLHCAQGNAFEPVARTMSTLEGAARCMPLKPVYACSPV